jgi:hypothetical protein
MTSAARSEVPTSEREEAGYLLRNVPRATGGLRHMRVTLLFTYSGITDPRIEPIAKAASPRRPCLLPGPERSAPGSCCTGGRSCRAGAISPPPWPACSTSRDADAISHLPVCDHRERCRGSPQPLRAATPDDHCLDYRTVTSGALNPPEVGDVEQDLDDVPVAASRAGVLVSDRLEHVVAQASHC